MGGRERGSARGWLLQQPQKSVIARSRSSNSSSSEHTFLLQRIKPNRGQQT